MDASTPGQLLREARNRRGVSQQRLATRAGTTQSVISRIESDRVSPTIETLRELLHLLGEDLILETEQREWGIDRSQVRERLRATAEERVDQGLAFGEFVLETQRANAA
jgi:transcriptional regulator with XRE-family HTH domain